MESRHSNEVMVLLRMSGGKEEKTVVATQGTKPTRNIHGCETSWMEKESPILAEGLENQCRTLSSPCSA